MFNLYMSEDELEGSPFVIIKSNLEEYNKVSSSDDSYNDKKKIKNLNNAIKSGKHIFLFIFMDGCGPCNNTKPSWADIKNKMDPYLLKRHDISIVEINQELFKFVENIGKEPMGYPTLRYVYKSKSEEYEDSEIENKDRSTESFVKWINSKLKKQDGGSRIKSKKYTRKASKKYKKKGGKWSLKYKRSINCKHPKGFSQRQHCKYGRK
jgi:hypothetical protein